MAPSLKQDVKYADENFVETLSDFNIRLPHSVKIKRFEGYRADWMALYKPESQMRSKAIIWINSDLYNIMRERNVDIDDADEIIEDSLYHEFMHIMLEMIEFDDQPFTHRIFEVYPDEEELAEMSIDFIRDNYIKRESKKLPIEDIVKRFAKGWDE